MTRTEKALRDKNVELLDEVQTLRKLVHPDQKALGDLKKGIVKLGELETTVNVLRNFKVLGVKTIQL